MLPRFFTKNVTRDVWLKTTRDMTYKQRASFFQNHLATALTYLEECQRRYQELDSPNVFPDVPHFFMDYQQLSNLSNAVHYLTKYSDHSDKIERELQKAGFADTDEEDDLKFAGASVANRQTLPCYLFKRKTNPHKHPLSDEQLDDYAIRNVATLMEKTPPVSARDYLYELNSNSASKFVMNRFRKMGARYGVEAYLLEHGYPQFLDRRATENFFGVEPPALGDITHVPKEYTEKVYQLADPMFLPKRQDLYPVFPWLDPNWSAPTNPMPPPPFYPATWYYFVENIGRLVYEVWTDEYITALAEYIGRRSSEVTGENLYRVLEIGAGDGRLSYFLRKKLDELGYHNIDIIPTDTGAWASDTWLPVARVDDTATTLRKHKPKMVICSWMIPREDLSKQFRKQPSVEEYILIGPPNGDIAGSTWETWGAGDKSADKPPPYTADGFQRYNLKYVSLFQIAQNYGPYFQFGSRTVSFRRMPGGVDYRGQYE